MPIYEYRCPSCNSMFELLRSFGNADKVAPCPHCNNHAKRKVSVFAAVGRSNGDDSASFEGGGGCAGCSAGSCAACH